MSYKPALKDGFISSMEYLRDEAARNLRPDVSQMLNAIICKTLNRYQQQEISSDDEKHVLELIELFCTCSDSARAEFIDFLIEQDDASADD